MRILIIGGTGNIGTGITQQLLAKGDDDLTLFIRGPERIPGVATVTGDRADFADFEKKVAQLGTFDAVIDMACFEPDEARCDVRCFRGRTRQFIFCSTVDTFTKPARRYPIAESDEQKPSAAFPYAYKKKICENIFTDAAGRGSFALTIIRPAATYHDAGYPLPLLGSGAQLLKRIREHRPDIVLGDGSSFWVSCHRDDTARAFVNACGNERTFGRSYNAAGDEVITWEAYFQTVADVLGAGTVDFVHIPTDLLTRLAPKSAGWCGANFQYNNIFDNTAAKQDLGFRYTVSWEEGARRMVEYHESRGDIDAAGENSLYDRIVGRFRSAENELAAEISLLDV